MIELCPKSAVNPLISVVWAGWAYRPGPNSDSSLPVDVCRRRSLGPVGPAYLGSDLFDDALLTTQVVEAR